MHRLSPWRALRRGGLAVVLVGSWAVSGPAVAATQQVPVPVTLSSVQVKGHAVAGVLTIRDASAGTAANVKATIAGVAVPVTIRPVSQQQRAAMLVVDTSGSMGASGMETVREATAAFLRAAPDDVLVGLVSFAGTAGVDVPLTKDRLRVQKAVNALRSRGETSLHDGVTTAVNALGTAGDRSIILLSDGGDTASVKASRATATATLKSRGVRAEVIGFKTGESDNSVLAGFAAAGGGSVAAAGDDAAVRKAFQAAAQALESQTSFTLQAPGALGSTQKLTLTGVASGRPFTVTTAVTLGAVATPAPSPTATPPDEPLIAADDQAAATVKALPPANLTTQLVLPLLAVFAGLLVLGLALVPATFRTKRQQGVETLERYLDQGRGLADRAAAKPSAISAHLVQFGDKMMEGRESTGRTLKLIDRADLPLRAGEWWVLRIVSVVLCTALCWTLLQHNALTSVSGFLLGGLIGWVLPAIVLRFLARRRCKKFEGQLPGLFMLAASSLQTGFSLPQALDAVAKDAPEPAAKEFSRTLAETRIGLDIADSLENMAVRMDSDNMRWTAMAIRIQREVGGNLAETLRTTAKTLRERDELRRHVRALSAEGRLSSYILVGLPIGLFVYMLQVNYEYISLLWTTAMGWAMSIGAVVMVGIGALWMRKVVDVEV